MFLKKNQTQGRGYSGIQVFLHVCLFLTSYMGVEFALIAFIWSLALVYTLNQGLIV